MPARPVLTTSLAVTLVGALAAAPVGASPGGVAAVPPAGVASSLLTVAEVAVGGRALSVGGVTLRSDTRGATPSAELLLTPLRLDGTTYGEQRSLPQAALDAGTDVDSRPFAPVGADELLRSQNRLVAGTRSTEDGASLAAGTSALGALEVLGLPLVVDGTMQARAAVDGTGSLSEKVLVVDELALPSLVDLLGALGLDVPALPAPALADLVDRLGLGDATVREAQAAVDALLAPVAGELSQAQSDLVDAGAAVLEGDAAVAQSRQAADAAAEVLDSAARALTAEEALAPAVLEPVLEPVDPVLEAEDPLDPLDPVLEAEDPLDPVLEAEDPLDPLDPVLEAEDPLDPLDPVLEAEDPLDPVLDPSPLRQAYLDALAAYGTAVARLDRAVTQVLLAESALAAVRSELDALLAPAAAELDALVGALTGALDRTPLLALEQLEVRGRSAVSADAGHAPVAEILGHVGAVRVLGEDVLAAVPGHREGDPLVLSTAAVDALDAAVAERLQVVVGILSSVPGLPRLDVPALQARVLRTMTATEDGEGELLGTASSTLRGLSLSVPAISVPAEVAVPAAGALPAVDVPLQTSAVLHRTRAGVGGVVSQPLALTLLSLRGEVLLAAAEQPGSAPVLQDPGAEAPPAGSPPSSPPPAPPVVTVPGAGSPPAPAPPSGDSPARLAAPGSPAPFSVVPVTSQRTLPRTGPPAGPALLGLVLLGTAFALRRRAGAGAARP